MLTDSTKYAIRSVLPSGSALPDMSKTTSAWTASTAVGAKRKRNKQQHRYTWYAAVARRSTLEEGVVADATCKLVVALTSGCSRSSASEITHPYCSRRPPGAVNQSRLAAVPRVA